MKRKDNRYVPKFGMSEKNAHGNTCDGLMLQKKTYDHLLIAQANRRVCSQGIV